MCDPRRTEEKNRIAKNDKNLKTEKNKHCHKKHTFSKLIMSSQVEKEDSNVYSFSTVLLLMYHLHEKIKAISFMSSHNKLSFWFIMICKCVCL